MSLLTGTFFNVYVDRAVEFLQGSQFECSSFSRILKDYIRKVVNGTGSSIIESSFVDSLLKQH